MSILDDAQQLVIDTRERDANVEKERVLRLEAAFRDAIFDALEVLGVESPRLNYGDRLERVVDNVFQVSFPIPAPVLIVRNAQGYSNMIELEEIEERGPKRTIQVNLADGATPEIIRRNWTTRIAKEWYGL